MSNPVSGITRVARSFRRALHQDFYSSAAVNDISQPRCFCSSGKHTKCSGNRVFNPSVFSPTSEKNIQRHQRYISFTRSVQLEKENQSNTNGINNDVRSYESTSSMDEISKEDLNLVVQATTEDESGIDQSSKESKSYDHLSDIPGANTGKGKKLAIVFTCSVCNTRSAKKFTEQAYLNGVVMVRCPGCQNLHLIADRLGFFEDRGEDGKGWDIEKLMKDMGENVKAVNSDNVLELTMEDILGKSKLEELQNNVLQGNKNNGGKSKS